MKVDKDGSTFTFASGKCMAFKYSQGSNLPVAYASLNKANNIPSVMSALLSLPTKRSPYILKGQKELLLWHAIFGHFDIRNVQQVLKSGGITVKETGSKTCSIPLCKLCLAGKAKCIGLESFTKNPNPDQHDVLKKNDLSPGDRVSTDQY